MTLFAAFLCGCVDGVVGDRGVRGATRHIRKAGWQRSTVLLVVLIVAGVGAASPAQVDAAPEDSEWHEFSGTWTAAGSRQVIALGDDRRASVADYSGSLLLYGTSRPALGFRAQAVVLDDSATGLIGRAVWTDDANDRVYSELRGEATPTGNRIIGTFVGGSGRYKGATGTYEFSWRFLIETEDGTVQGQSMGLSGKVRFVPSQSGTGASTPEP
jgi:hypothetical protein